MRKGYVKFLEEEKEKGKVPYLRLTDSGELGQMYIKKDGKWKPVFIDENGNRYIE